MRLKKALLMCTLMSGMCLALFACGNKQEEEVVVEETADASAEPVEVTVEEEPGYVSKLTGEAFDETGDASLRPVAVMVPNDNYGALPQYGLSLAGVVYEVPVEPPYTRLMAIYDQASFDELTTVGPVRSCRLYYCYFDLEFDAIYTHYGESEYAKSFLSSGQIDEMDGMDSTIDSIVFWRDSSRTNPDNAFTSGENLLAGIEYKGFDTSYSEDYEGKFTFASDEVSLSDGEDATTVYPGYPSNVNVANPWFEYNSEDGLYYRYEYSASHNDALTGNQLSVKNIIIQACDYSVMEKHNTYNFDTTSGGSGYYITNGKAIPVTWSKESEYAPAKYFDADGNEIEFNTGKTWVCIIKSSDIDSVSFSNGTSGDDTSTDADTTTDAQ